VEIRHLTVPFEGAAGKKVLPLFDLHSLIKLTPIGDIHLGNRGCDEAELAKWVNIIAADPNHYTILMGDLAECILPGDKRFDPQEVAEWLWTSRNRGRIADAQYERINEILSKIPSKRILGSIEGNHERTIRDRHQRDLTLDLCRDLGIPYLGQEAFLQLRLQYKNTESRRRSIGIKLFITHGSGAGRKAGAKVNKLTDITSWVNCDVLLMGHHHDRLAVRTVQLDLDQEGHLLARQRLHIMTGTFLKTFSEGTAGYGARELYPPTSIGPVTVTIHPRTGELGTII